METTATSPKKEGNRISRAKKLTLRYSQEEINLIRNQADFYQLSYNDYVLQLVKGDTLVPRLQPKTIREIMSISNNLNQLTRFAHLGNLDKDAILEIMQKLQKMLE